MDRGENLVSCRLPGEAMLPLIDFQHKHRLGSKSQSATQIIIKYLHEHEYLSDDDLEAIKERTKIFKKDEHFNKERMIRYKKTIEESRKTTTEIEIPAEDIGFLRRMPKQIKFKENQYRHRKISPQQYQRYLDKSREFAEQYQGTPIADKVIKKLKNAER